MTRKLRLIYLLLAFFVAGCASNLGKHDATHHAPAVPMFDDHGRSLGCSWYCGAPPVSVTASSTLRDGIYSYDPENIHDTQKSTVWAEGDSGSGVGTRITFTFDYSGERYRDRRKPDGIDTFSLINGFARSPELWAANSRVKTFRLAFNGQDIGTFGVSDTAEPQKVSLPKLTFRPGRKNRLVFEIAEVYPGTIHDDTCIADIIFDGFGPRG